MDTALTPVQKFYDGQCVFITGATGFIGKVLVEKLLRSCPGIKKIYVLLRAKNGQMISERLEEMLQSQVFDRIRAECPSPLLKVTAVTGELGSPDLGIGQSDLDTLSRNVAVFFHSAATVKFDEPLRISVQINLMGTKYAVEVAKKMPNLKSFVHVSTAYCNCDRDDIEEIIYPPPMPPQLIMDTLEWIDDALLESITSKLIKGRPNTYTFTKALAETFLMENAKDLPLAIIRPSIVTAAWKEPFPGWIDNMNGCTGMFLACGKGILRTMLTNPKIVADFIPVDVVINQMIVVGWHAANKSPGSSIPVFNCTSGAINSVTWKTIEKVTFAALKRNPSADLVRYPIYIPTGNRWVFLLRCLVNHILPAAVMDGCMMLTGKKPRMVRLFNKIHKAIMSLEHFTTHEWKFDNKHSLKLHTRLGDDDQKVFGYNIASLSWSDYMNNYVLGIRRFLLKEEESTLAVARKKMRILYLKSQLVNLVMYLLFLRFLIQRSSVFKSLWFSIIGRLLRLYSQVAFIFKP